MSLVVCSVSPTSAVLMLLMCNAKQNKERKVSLNFKGDSAQNFNLRLFTNFEATNFATYYSRTLQRCSVSCRAVNKPSRSFTVLGLVTKDPLSHHIALFLSNRFLLLKVENRHFQKRECPSSRWVLSPGTEKPREGSLTALVSRDLPRGCSAAVNTRGISQRSVNVEICQKLRIYFCPQNRIGFLFVREPNDDGF